LGNCKLDYSKVIIKLELNIFDVKIVKEVEYRWSDISVGLYFRLDELTHV